MTQRGNRYRQITESCINCNCVICFNDRIIPIKWATLPNNVAKGPNIQQCYALFSFLYCNNQFLSLSLYTRIFCRSDSSPVTHDPSVPPDGMELFTLISTLFSWFKISHTSSQFHGSILSYFLASALQSPRGVAHPIALNAVYNIGHLFRGSDQ